MADWRFPTVIKALLSLCLTTVLTGCEGAPPLADHYLDLPSAGLKLRPPVGFELEEDELVLVDRENGPFVEIGRIPTSYHEIAERQTAEYLRQQEGKKLLDRQPFSVGDYEGTISKLAYSRLGSDYLQWSLQFGDDEQYFFVNAKAPDDSRSRFDETLRQCVESVELLPLDPDPSTRPYEIDAVEGLQRVKDSAYSSHHKGWGIMSTYDVDGALPTASPADPMLIVAPSFGKVRPIDDLEGHARFCLNHTADTEVDAIDSVEAVTVDGQPGVEIIAAGRDIETETKLAIYQLLLNRADGGHVLIGGYVGADQAEHYLPRFQAAARSFRWNAN